MEMMVGHFVHESLFISEHAQPAQKLGALPSNWWGAYYLAVDEMSPEQQLLMLSIPGPTYSKVSS
jgi:hypothetical protein